MKKKNSNACSFIFKSPHEKESRTVLHFWIPRHGCRIHELEFRLFVRGTWILYSIFSWIPDSEAQDSWIPRAKFPPSRIPQVMMFNNYSSSSNGLWVSFGLMGYWLRGHEGVACVVSVSVRFRSKERVTRVKDRATNGGQNRKSPSSVFLCSET